MLALIGLFAGTFVSEDLACVAAGVLVARGDVSVFGAVVACTLGIFIGDLGLWALGRLGAQLLRGWGSLNRLVSGDGATALRASLERHAAAAIIASRFIPGTRLPLYVTAGGVRMSPVVFSAWTLLAGLLWTPALVLMTAGVSRTIVGAVPFGTWSAALVCLAMVGSTCAMQHTRAGSRTAGARLERIAARLARWRRWEFWPMPLFYAPVAVWVLWLAARHRGMSTITAANPGIVDGGTVGESKGAILARLPPEYTIPFALLPGGESADVRARGALEIVGRRGWSLPLIMKPDVGQRGAGVRLVRSAEEVSSYLRREPRAVLLQPYHEGPFEAGVFYYRFPHQKRGRIFSITDKIFPVIVGDGRSTVGELIWAHPRYRLQADLFCRRHTDVIGRTLSRGERLTLAVAGNHAQGALFLNGAHLNTTALEERIDDIARSFPGFFIGRFDIRYRSVEDFKAGRDLAIVELNGSMAESTAIYDPDTSLLDAYRELFAQWRLVFAIGSANRALGAPVSSTRRLITLFAAHVSAPAPAISD